MLPLQEELWHFFLSDNKPGSLPYWRGNKNKCYNNNMDYKVCNHVMLMPMLMPMLSFYNKIHTWGQNFFFLLEKICYRAGPKETFLKMKTLSVKAKAYSCKRKTISTNFEKCHHIAAVVLLWEYCHSHSFLSAFQACALILPLSVWIALIYFLSHD